jgi:hypothetical protein
MQEGQSLCLPAFLMALQRTLPQDASSTCSGLCLFCVAAPALQLTFSMHLCLYLGGVVSVYASSANQRRHIPEWDLKIPRSSCHCHGLLWRSSLRIYLQNGPEIGGGRYIIL